MKAKSVANDMRFVVESAEGFCEPKEILGELGDVCAEKGIALLLVAYPLQKCIVFFADLSLVNCCEQLPSEAIKQHDKIYQE